MEHLYKRIKEARERSGMTVSDAARSLGVTRTQIWRLEHKSKTITAERLFEIADLYGVDARQLLQGKDTPPPFRELYRRIGEVVTMVEEQVQTLDARPDPSLIGEAVVEILRQEATDPGATGDGPFDPSRYRGLVALLIKQAGK